MLLKVCHFRSKKVPIRRRQDSSITDGDVVRGAGDLQSRIQAIFFKSNVFTRQLLTFTDPTFSC